MDAEPSAAREVGALEEEEGGGTDVEEFDDTGADVSRPILLVLLLIQSRPRQYSTTNSNEIPRAAKFCRLATSGKLRAGKLAATGQVLGQV